MQLLRKAVAYLGSMPTRPENGHCGEVARAPSCDAAIIYWKSCLRSSGCRAPAREAREARSQQI